MKQMPISKLKDRLNGDTTLVTHSFSIQHLAFCIEFMSVSDIYSNFYQKENPVGFSFFAYCKFWRNVVNCM